MAPIIFPSIVGQEYAKNRLSFYLQGYERTSLFPHAIFIAPKGIGKTMFAREVATVLKRRVKDDGREKALIEINSSTLKSVRQFIEQIVMNYVHEKDCTLFFDEIHDLSPKVVSALLTILNPNSDNRNDFRFGDMVFNFDFKRVTFLAATTERQRVFGPLLDRMTEIHLNEYNAEEVAKIVRSNLASGISAKDDALAEIAKYCRGNGRSAAIMGGFQGISNYCATTGKRVFEVSDVPKLVKILDLFPLGLSRMEVNMLLAIASKQASSLTMLAAKSGLSKAAQMDIEKVFLKYGFIDIETGHGRSITAEGQKYLKAIKSSL